MGYCPQGRKELDMTEVTWHSHCSKKGFLSDSVVKKKKKKQLPAMQEMQETQVGPLGSKDPLKESMATHSSIFCQENPMNRGAWRATVHGVSKRQTQMK